MPKQRPKTLPAEITKRSGIVPPRTTTRSIPLFDPYAFLSKAGLGRRIVNLKKDQTIFSQGDPAETVFYIQSGKIKLSVISSKGKEATIALLGEGDFVGEECIATRPAAST